MPVREQRRPPAFSLITVHEYALSEFSASSRDLSPLVSDAAHCIAALHRPVVESTAESDDPEFGEQVFIHLLQVQQRKQLIIQWKHLRL